MAQRREVLLARLNSLCATAPFELVQTASPFDFDHQPSGAIEGAFRITAEHQDVLGGLAYSEDQTDLMTIWVARRHTAGAVGAYDRLLTDVTSLRGAIVRDGSVGGGDFHVPDGGSVSVEQTNGQEFAVARMAIPINYEVQL